MQLCAERSGAGERDCGPSEAGGAGGCAGAWRGGVVEVEERGGRGDGGGVRCGVLEGGDGGGGGRVIEAEAEMPQPRATARAAHRAAPSLMQPREWNSDR